MTRRIQPEPQYYHDVHACTCAWCGASIPGLRACIEIREGVAVCLSCSRAGGGLTVGEVQPVQSDEASARADLDKAGAA